MIPLSTMTPAERERLCYAEGFTEAAKLLAEIDELTAERDSLVKQLEHALPVRYFIVDYELEDGPDLVEVQERDFLLYEGEITYERHSIRENGVNQICLTKGLST